MDRKHFRKCPQSTVHVIILSACSLWKFKNAENKVITDFDDVAFHSKCFQCPRLPVWCRWSCWHVLWRAIGTVSVSGQCGRTSVQRVRGTFESNWKKYISPKSSSKVHSLAFCQASAKLLFSHPPPTEVRDWGWCHAKFQTSTLWL